MKIGKVSASVPNKEAAPAVLAFELVIRPMALSGSHHQHLAIGSSQLIDLAAQFPDSSGRAYGGPARNSTGVELVGLFGERDPISGLLKQTFVERHFAFCSPHLAFVAEPLSYRA
ncbi:hypothetical protein [Mesorhizobium sp.]|uniref:hypothetical protein n=1 Tax=Mesorhizobium sp. TaxID=1871066 RepID=UPI0025DAE6B5|nr:hypothetical protein [Mesorhizobium sp.]